MIQTVAGGRARRVLSSPSRKRKIIPSSRLSAKSGCVFLKIFVPPRYYGAYLAFLPNGECVGVINQQSLELLQCASGRMATDICDFSNLNSRRTLERLLNVGLLESSSAKRTRLHVISPDKQTGTRHTGEGAQRFINFFYEYFGNTFLEGSPLIDSHREFLHILCKYFPKEPSLCMDAGCGSGFYTSALAQLGHTVYACDINTNRVRMASSQLNGTGQIIPIQCCLESIPLPDRSIEFVMCNFVLEHVADPFAVLAELLRVLKPKGKLLIAVPSLNLRDTLAAWIDNEMPTLNFEHLRSYGLIPGTHPWCEPTLKTVEYLTASGNSIDIIEGVNILMGLPEPWLSAFNVIAQHVGLAFSTSWPWNLLGQQTIIYGTFR